MDGTASDRTELLEEWLAAVLGGYPPEAARQMTRDRDPFRNPSGHLLRQNLAVLLEAVLREKGHPDAARALEDLVRLRAVQDFTASQAVAFLLPLKPILAKAIAVGHPAVSEIVSPPALGRASSAATACRSRDRCGTVYDDRIDQLVLLASDLYVNCREKMHELRANEARRRTWLFDRIGARQ